ncbi:MAG: hypothetical protein GX119_06685 [Syntrophomonadaceae bacterium]|jgi:hypothetical protein|nr:hypothetical protein [Syntrophomonadaceae bacterium]
MGRKVVDHLLIALGIMAGIIFMVYGIYFASILRGNPQAMEGEMGETFALWLNTEGKSGRLRLSLLLLGSLLLEGAYFILVFTLLHNPVMIILTLILAGEELLHVGVVINAVNKYWRGKIEAQQIFNWIIERVSAIFFFTHAFLVLVNILVVH